jgi:hypothetical protein
MHDPPLATAVNLRVAPVQLARNSMMEPPLPPSLLEPSTKADARMHFCRAELVCHIDDNDARALVCEQSGCCPPTTRSRVGDQHIRP